MTFIPKHAVLKPLSLARLTELARHLGLPGGTRKELLTRLASVSDQRFWDLLQLLTIEELRAVTRAHRLPDYPDRQSLAECITDGPASKTKKPPTPEIVPDNVVRLGPKTPAPVRPLPPTNDDALPTNVTRLPKRLSLVPSPPEDPPPPPLLPSKPTVVGGNDLHAGFETTLWQAADKLRNNMDAAEYKHVVLGLLFLRYISDAFEAHRTHLVATGADPEDRANYLRERMFWVPSIARWPQIFSHAHAKDLGATIDAAMAAIETENPSLRHVLPQIYRRPGLEGPLLGELLHLFDTIDHGEQRGRDLLGRVYEYFLTRFASAEGKNGGQFYTPRSVVHLLVAMLAPTHGSVYDPACGSGGMFVQSERFLVEHGGKHGDLAIFGQESNPTTWRLARMNLALRGIEGNLGPEHADSFHRDHHPDLRADYILANPPFNTKDWGGPRLAGDPRWQFGAPPPQNANFAWVQHIIHHMAPNGVAGFVLANGAMTTTTASEGPIRRKILEADLVDCMVALPSQLFYSTQIPVSLWVLARNKADPKLRDRRGNILMIDAREFGSMADRTHRILSDHDVDWLANLYHHWRGDHGPTVPADHPGVSRNVTLAEVASKDHILAPSRYIAAHRNAPTLPIHEELRRLNEDLRSQIHSSHELDQRLTSLLDKLFPTPS